MSQIREFELEYAGEAQVEFLDEPPTYQGELHERRWLPLVPEEPEFILHGIPELN